MGNEIKSIYSEFEEESTPYNKGKGCIKYILRVDIFECSLVIGDVTFISYLERSTYKIVDTYHGSLIEEEEYCTILREEESYVSSQSRAIRLGIATFDKYKIRALKHVPVGKTKNTKEEK